MVRHPKHHKAQRGGFTIVELLIVIVVIAILAAITIIAYNGVTSRAKAAALQSTLQQAASKLEIYKVDNGTYPPDQATVASLVNFDSSTTQTYATGSSASSPAYCLVAVQETLQYSVGSANNTPGVSACVMNLLVNPGFEAASTTGWTYEKTGTALSVVTTEKHDGTYSQQVATPGSTTSEGTNTSRVALDAPGPVAGSAWVKAAPGVRLLVGLEEYVMPSTYVATRGQTIFTGNGAWQLINATGSFGTTGNAVRLIVRTVDTSATTFYVDSVILTRGSTVYNYADGNSPGWSWTGTPNASTSFGPAL